MSIMRGGDRSLAAAKSNTGEKLHDERNGMKKMRLHDLRHSCASLLLANGVPLKQIQDWLGHSDFSTTANIYAHLDYSSKISSAQAMVSGMFLPDAEGFQSKWSEIEKSDDEAAAR